MEIKDDKIDQGKPFDWGRVSEEYARYRDIYPPEFYRAITDRGLCVDGQRVLDLATGTGVLPRNLYSMGAKWTGVDISDNQITYARELSQGKDITYLVSMVEDVDFEDCSFDVITACQCFWYFDHDKLAPKLAHMLTKDGRLLILYMAWLPFQDDIAGQSEKLVLRYNPKWSGAGETIRPIDVPDIYKQYFEVEDQRQFEIKVHFTRESWHGRMKACRGVGASLTPSQLREWEQEHLKLLSKIAPQEFDVLHYVAIAELSKK